MARLLALALTAATALLATAAPAAHAARGLTVGFSSDPVLTAGTASATPWIGRAAAEQAGIVRVNVVWAQIAPVRRPRGFVAADPSSPGYTWAPIDTAVRDLSAHGLTVLLNVSTAPAWAEGPHRPRSARAGTWRPDPAQFASFATAAALRYDGSYPDPAQPGSSLPRVRYWQGWNEPNLDYYLSPQWTRTGHGYAPASPAIYRALLNAFYSAVKAVKRSNFVVAAGTAPYGDGPGGQRIQPVAFDRGLFCLQGAVALKPVQCPDPVHLDAVSHHPYATGGPLQPAFNPDDAAVPDIYKIARVLRAAERTGHVLPRGRKRLWVTEISWDSSPPDPHGVPIAEHARWLEQALYVLWSQGVDTVLWLQIVDSPPIPSYAASYQAGLFYLNGRPKPAALAFRFPFVTKRLGAGRVQAWGRAPAAGELAIEQRAGAHWDVIRRVAVRARQVFVATLDLQGKSVLRAQLGGRTSLTWTQPA
jgi:hypothetical protein